MKVEEKAIIYSSVRVKRLIDGKASGKSFRVYKATIGTEHEYLKYRGNAKVDHLVIDFEVTESYERIQPAIKRNLREGYVRKSSACPKTLPSSRKVKVDMRPRKSVRKERINELLRYFSRRRKDHSKVMSNLVAYKKATWSKQPKK